MYKNSRFKKNLIIFAIETHGPMKNRSNTILYRPKAYSILLDLLFIFLSVILTLYLAPLTTEVPFAKYWMIILQYVLVWTFFSYLAARYKKMQGQQYFNSIFKLSASSFLTILVLWYLMSLPAYDNFSLRVILAFTILLFLINLIFLTFYFAVQNAVEYSDEDEIRKNVDDKVDETIFQRAAPLDNDSYDRLKDSVCLIDGRPVFDFISRHVDLKLDHNYVSYAANFWDIRNLDPNKIFNLIIFKRLNFVGDMSRLLALVNNKIPAHGYFICAFEEKNVRNFTFYQKYPKWFAQVISSLDYVYHRVLPKLFLTKGFYKMMTDNSLRSLSKSEVLGRLQYSGFEIMSEKKIEQITYVVSRKRRTVKMDLQEKKYGFLIKLRRMGLKGKKFNVYKFRTMYPYSEFIQSYMYNKYYLQRGGKINKDIRISPVGKFLRKYWLDELPMIYNMLKGDMKLVGVRPLSEHFFSLYDEELQILRTQFKPGLLPPFYADLPNTLEEIQMSEMKYLRECEKSGTFMTDLRYLKKILNNILIKKARSA